MFTDEHTLDYSSPLIFDVYADDFLEVESDAENIYNDPFNSKGKKIKESKLLINELDLPYDFHPPPEYDSFISQDFSKVDALPSTNNEDKNLTQGEKIKESKLLMNELDLPCNSLPYSKTDSFNSQDFSKVDDLPSPDNEDKAFSRDDALPSPDNEDKVFNPGILIHENSVKIITRVAQEKKRAVSFASLLFEDFDPPLYELLVFKEVSNSIRLLPFSSKNEEKVFKPGIYTSEKFHSYFLPELSHPGYHVFKVNLNFLSLMKIFHVQSGKNTPLLDVLLFHFYPA
nr:hypothetical protein [Tanacetum cinerariifolium]